MKNCIRTIEDGIVRRTMGEALLFAAGMLLAEELFGCAGDGMCPFTASVAVAAVAFGITEMVTALREAVD